MAEYKKVIPGDLAKAHAQQPPALAQSLGLRRGDVISLVGGGGKTSLMFSLAGELASAGSRVITTTTTKIMEPGHFESPLLILEADEDKLTREVGLKMDEYRHITVAKESLPSGKLGGISPEAVIKLSRLASVDYIIVEADGAARKPLKAPNSTEPVIPANTTLVVAVVGIEAVGRELTGENVFRPEIVSQLTGLSPGDFVTGDAVAVLITHPLGLTRGSPSEARIIPFINKMDLDPGFVRGRELAEAVISRGHPRIERVILGRLQSSSPVVEIISK